MRKNDLMKRLLLILMALSLVMALVPATFAQEGEGSEGEGQTEQVEGGEAAEGEEEAAHSDGEEEGGLLTPLGINGGLLIAQVVNFLLIAGMMARFIWQPAVNMLDNRTQTIQKGLEDAAAASKARLNAEEEAEKILAEARQERGRLLEEARAAADEVKKGLEADVRQEAEKIRNDAQVEARTARDAELANLRDQVLAISTAVASRVLESEIDADAQRGLISDFFSNVPQGATDLSGEVEIVSAMPLEDAERQQVEGAISADSYTYTVDPTILGGLIVRSADRVIDGSIRTSLNEVSDRLR